MKCVFCGNEDSRVIDSRSLKDGSIRRRRECERCHKRFSSYETIERNPMVVINVEGIREPFCFDKLKESITYATYCRNVGSSDVMDMTKEVERRLLGLNKQEISTMEIVSVVSQAISEVDEVAAFVYHIQHNDINNILDVKRFF
ncbi:MAG: transcriptional repressor NrdR [Clostridia bacterium]|nr:transcriptional repressor NrdR [Clostridia bacterium]